jgi:hypothetical protein
MSISQPEIIKLTCDVSEDNTHTDAAYVGTGHVFGVQVPTIDNAKIDWEASIDGSTWYSVVDENLNSIEVNAGGGEYFAMMDGLHVGGPYVRIVFGSAQTSDRELYIVVKD